MIVVIVTVFRVPCNGDVFCLVSIMILFIAKSIIYTFPYYISSKNMFCRCIFIFINESTFSINCPIYLFYIIYIKKQVRDFSLTCFHKLYYFTKFFSYSFFNT